MTQDTDSPRENRLEMADQMTSLQLRRAVGGDADSLTWVVRRLSPLLIAQADYRLGPDLRKLYDAEDLVSEVWMVALPRLGDLSSRDGRQTPVLLKFLTTTLTFRINNLLRQMIRRRSHAEGEPERLAGLEDLPARTRGAITQAVRRETVDQVAASLEGLEPQDREIILLRGIEQQTNGEVAAALDLTPKAVSTRYHRALDKLRARLPCEVFDELPG